MSADYVLQRNLVIPLPYTTKIAQQKPNIFVKILYQPEVHSTKWLQCLPHRNSTHKSNAGIADGNKWKLGHVVA
jgi:hypothetical protein